MNKKNSVTYEVGVGLLLLGLTGTVQATLYDRGNGMIYDSAQDLTWLQDANYARTSGYSRDGRMTWHSATVWATNLDYGGYNDWRLPTVTDNSNDRCNWSYNGAKCGYNVDTSTSEMAYMWYDTLGNTPYYDADGNGPQLNWGLTNTGADGVNFQNLQSGYYWLDTGYASGISYAWRFDTHYGSQGGSNKDYVFYAWAVRSGDVAPVPLPAAVWLFGAGLASLGVFRRHKKETLTT